LQKPKKGGSPDGKGRVTFPDSSKRKRPRELPSDKGGGGRRLTKLSFGKKRSGSNEQLGRSVVHILHNCKRKPLGLCFKTKKEKRGPLFGEGRGAGWGEAKKGGIREIKEHV